MGAFVRLIKEKCVWHCCYHGCSLPALSRCRVQHVCEAAYRALGRLSPPGHLSEALAGPATRLSPRVIGYHPPQCSYPDGVCGSSSRHWAILAGSREVLWKCRVCGICWIVCRCSSCREDRQKPILEGPETTDVQRSSRTMRVSVSFGKTKCHNSLPKANPHSRTSAHARLVRSNATQSIRLSRTFDSQVATLTGL